MPAMILFTLFGLLLLAVLVLVLAVYRLDSYINKQSKRLQDLMHGTRSGSHPTPSQKEAFKVGTPCETCHMCGGLRLRLPQSSVPAAMPDKMKSSQLVHRGDFSGSPERSLPSPPWDHWLAVKCRIALTVKQMLQRLVVCKKRQTQGGLLKSLHRVSRFLRLKGIARVPEPVSSMPASNGSHYSELATTHTVETESTSPGLGFSSSLSELHLQPDIVKNSDVHRKTDVDMKDAPVHKLVLEILMSSSGNMHDKSHRSCSSASSASSLRLKLEASANLEQLVGYAEALSSKGFQTCENTNKDGDVASLLCHPGDTFSAYEGQVCHNRSSLVLHTAASVPHVCGKCAEYHGQSGLTGIPAPEKVLQDADGFHARKMVIVDGFKAREQCAQSLRSDMECNSGSSLDSVPVNDRLKHNGELKIRLYNEVNKGIASKPAPPSADESVEVSSLASDMGSLSITFLKADNECKVQSEGAEKRTGQVGSPLASINVSGKLAGSSGLRSGKREKMNKTGHSLHSGSFNTKFAGGVVEGSGHTYPQDMDEGGEHATMQGSTEKSFNNNASPSKEDKKKKKGRGKKARAKSGPLVSDSCEMQEIGKIAFEAIKLVSPVPEREIGCVCGASKGDPHAESCPYPFTSSGSMLQRKIKEQYNILVKSNAAKTLTLAQVGQFTTCLVEAKEALQQKSEMIQRKFTIAKSLLSKADKSSFDRLCGQIYSLEMEQKRLEEDTAVYNRLQEQLKLSPAYKKMLEYGRAHFELQPHTGQMIEKLEPEDMEMSFEELLAQEKKDVFWQRHSFAKSGVPAS